LALFAASVEKPRAATKASPADSDFSLMDVHSENGGQLGIQTLTCTFRFSASGALSAQRVAGMLMAPDHGCATCSSEVVLNAVVELFQETGVFRLFAGACAVASGMRGARIARVIGES
jgi:hypothetical protein